MSHVRVRLSYVLNERFAVFEIKKGVKRFFFHFEILCFESMKKNIYEFYTIYEWVWERTWAIATETHTKTVCSTNEAEQQYNNRW